MAATTPEKKTPQRDIQNRRDIRLLMEDFYVQIKKDKLLGPVFTEQFTIKWDKHLDTMCDFWDNILFYSGAYAGNPMELHTRLNKVQAINKTHFKRWLTILHKCVDQHFSGEKATLMKIRASKIAAIMLHNLAQTKPS